MEQAVYRLGYLLDFRQLHTIAQRQTQLKYDIHKFVVMQTSITSLQRVTASH